MPTARPHAPSLPALGTRFVAPLSGLLLLAAAGCAPSAPPAQQAGPVAPESKNTGVQKGEASFYADHFEGRSMANGETFSQSSDSAASKTLPLGSKAQVKNLENGRTAVVTIEDRGPHVAGRVIDVSKQTAKRLDMVEDGTAKVEVKPLSSGGK
ncbi:MAG TPA: septal ring lytic transglycosylase RlpA family protein [Roseomonas sp.]|nr:septal ring lytic transglycosylase RlpA family protein [Roseomonas sp.]